jgi:hypothetical protein
VCEKELAVKITGRKDHLTELLLIVSIYLRSFKETAKITIIAVVNELSMPFNPDALSYGGIIKGCGFV